MDTTHIIEVGRSAGRLWSQQAPAARRRILSRLAAVLAARQDELVAAIVTDTGKPALDALGGDVLVTLEQMRYYHRHAHKVLAPRRVPADRLLFYNTRFTEMFEPHGVVLIYGTANYPLQLAMVPAITALYAGNAVVLKLSERTPALAELLRACLVEAQLPTSLVQIVCDPPATAGDYIDARPDFICFTGSCKNGQHVAERAALLLIPTLMELGGKDAAIVFSDCNLDRTIEGVVYGAFSNSGQVCVGIKRLYVQRSVYPQFMLRLTQRIHALAINVREDASNDVAPLTSTDLLQQLHTQITDALDRGASVSNDTADHSGATPLVLTDVPRDALLLQEESFGPVLCVFPFDNEEDAIQHVNESAFALGASVWTRDAERAERLASRMHAANIAVNDVIRNIANPSTSFGGNQFSGYGRYHGPAGLRTFSRTKTVMHSHSNAAQERNWFPFTAKKYALVRTLIRLRYQVLARYCKF